MVSTAATARVLLTGLNSTFKATFFEHNASISYPDLLSEPLASVLLFLSLGATTSKCFILPSVLASI